MWICLAALAAVLLLGMTSFDTGGSSCGSPMDTLPFSDQDPCISAIWTRRVIMIVVGLAAVMGLVYGLRRSRRMTSDR